MTFAYQILSMTNYCNLRCKYCDWNKVDGFSLSQEQICNARRNIKWSREFADKEFGDFLMGVYSGGEPFLFPELIEMFLEMYADKWVRISTNGLFDANKSLAMLKKHQRLILTASLDGLDFESNRARFHSEKQLRMVVKNIYQALSNGILVMVLCTINKYNIDHFFEFTEELYRIYRPYVDCGQLVMPAHYMTAYINPDGLPSMRQEEEFIRKLEKEIYFNPIMSKVDWHYKQLMDYVKTKRHDTCKVAEWSRCAHFLEDNMVDGEKMNSYLCPMRGYGDLGEFSVGKGLDGFGEFYDKRYEEIYGKGERCRCFVDWTAFDSILKGEVSLKQAESWFQFFADDEVKNWIFRYQKSQKV